MAITFKNIPVSKIFIDGVEEKIFICDEANPRGRREPHRGAKGYQRDPWARKSWVEKRKAIFSEDLMRPIEVAKRSDDTFACIDGGGRWLMKQLIGHTTMLCRIHEGLSRKDEAFLFSLMDSEVYKLRSIDNFLAQLGGGEEMATAIASAAKPYRIAVSGSGTLKAVVPLTRMYVAFETDEGVVDHEAGAALISTVCRAAADGWSACRENGKPVGKQIEAKFLMALALVIDAAGDRLDMQALHKALVKNPTNELARKIAELNGGSVVGVKTVTFAVQTAKNLVKTYNRSFAGQNARKISLSDIDNSGLVDIFENGPNYSAMVRAAREIDAAEMADEEDEAA